MNSKEYEFIIYETNKIDNNIQEKYVSKFELLNPSNFPKDKESKNSNRKKIKNFTWNEDYNDDFLLSFRKKFDDIFKEIKGHEKIFEYLRKEHKRKKKVSNEVIKGAVFLRKLKFNENFPKIKRKKTIKVDVDKVVEIQRIFKGYFVRNINLKLDRLKLRQCLLELFCLLIYGDWYRAKIRAQFNILKYAYNAAKLDVGKELNFSDKISFKLPKCFYTGTKINNLNSERIGKDF